ncbi:MAG: hypothetical protein ACD_11C00077G0003 [uncultured bacterium]|nr:MAG: hypothetical protein ACD_11C00077G0003 [uncultured bacterium]
MEGNKMWEIPKIQEQKDEEKKFEKIVIPMLGDPDEDTEGEKGEEQEEDHREI